MGIMREEAKTKGHSVAIKPADPVPAGQSCNSLFTLFIESIQTTRIHNEGQTKSSGFSNGFPLFKFNSSDSQRRKDKTEKCLHHKIKFSIWNLNIVANKASKVEKCWHHVACWSTAAVVLVSLPPPCYVWLTASSGSTVTDSHHYIQKEENLCTAHLKIWLLCDEW